MKKRSLFLTLAVAALALGLSAPAAQAGAVPLSSLLGTTVSFDGLDFTFDTYVPTGNAPDASLVNVTFSTESVNGVTEICFTLNASFGAIAGENNDANLIYSVAPTKGGPFSSIVDAFLEGNPASSGGTGLASVTETLHSGGLLGPTIGLPFGHIQNPGPLSDSTTFAPQTMITVVKDIESRGGDLGVSLSQVTQCFSPQGVPEPASMALLGVGMVGLIAFRRLFKRNARV